MIATQTELTEFHQFARQKLSAGSAASLQELLDEWNAAREYERSVEKIGESMRQYEAGQCMPLDEAAARIQTSLERAELNEYYAELDHNRSVEKIRESIRECEAGLGFPVKEAFAEIRAKLGWMS